MDISLICTRKRKEFGKPCPFVDLGPNLILEIDPSPDQRRDFYMIPTIDKEIDNSTGMCSHEVNTVSYPTESRGMNHMEGGWPASVDSTDEESMARFRKKVEKDKSYVNSVKSLADFLENFIMENNSIDIYEEYFDGELINRNTDFSVRNISVFSDLTSCDRKISDLSWTRDSSKFAAAYTLKQTGEYPDNICVYSYVWDVENCISPVYVFKPEVFMTCVECSQTDVNLILSGYLCGQVALWDIRSSQRAQVLSNSLESHTQKVTGLKWLIGKHDMAFFSTSTDGKMISWDARNMSYPTEVVKIDDTIPENSNLSPEYTISCSEYDVTLPNKFMVGTEQGVVLSFNRKYKKIKETLGAVYDCSSGPLFAVERNAFFPQLFATCGTSSVNMWCDAVSDFPILNMVSRDGYFTDIAWSPTRASTLYASKTTGVLEVWDIPGKYENALMKINVAAEPVLAVAVNYSGGQIACGTSSGSVQLLNIPEYLRSSSDTETDLVRNCVRECDKVIGGKPRSERFLGKGEECMVRVVDYMWDPPEKAEELYEEFNIASTKFSSEYICKIIIDENDTDIKITENGIRETEENDEVDINENEGGIHEIEYDEDAADVNGGIRESEDNDEDDINENEGETREVENDEDDTNINMGNPENEGNDEDDVNENEEGNRETENVDGDPNINGETRESNYDDDDNNNDPVNEVGIRENYNDDDTSEH